MTSVTRGGEGFSPSVERAEAGLRPTEEQHSAGSWLLVYVVNGDADLIVGHSPDFDRVIDGLFGEDNGLTRPKALQPGLYRVQPARLWEDEDDIEIEGEWRLVLSVADALASSEVQSSSRRCESDSEATCAGKEELDEPSFYSSPRIEEGEKP